MKLCIVVGLGRGGIGDALVRKFAAEGFHVAMVARSNLQRLETNTCKSFVCDVGQPEQVKSTVQNIKETFAAEKLDALMYNVGSGVFKHFDDTTYDEFATSWKVGPAGLFSWTKECADWLQEGSSVGVTGATASWRGMPFTPSFASSKMATRGLVQALARDWGPSKGIHVFHVIIDGIVDLNPDKRRAEGSKQDNEVLSSDDIAETYWQLHNQPKTCWTQETHLAAQGAFGSIASI